MNHKQIAIDGPASAGKSTVAKLVAKKLNFVYCDTGAMYRAATWLALAKNVAISDTKKVATLAETMQLKFLPPKEAGKDQQVFVNGTDVTEAIRMPEIAKNVSAVAAIPEVRAALVKLQRIIANDADIVMDGRDIGTTVLPDAFVKIFLVASVEERAMRRYKENVAKGIASDLEELKKQIALRDHKDETRKVSPLTKAADAIEVDTTSMTIDQVVARIMAIVQNAN